MKKTISFKITSKRVKYIKINLIEEVKGLYMENHKTLMKKLKIHINRYSLLMDYKNYIVKIKYYPKKSL